MRVWSSEWPCEEMQRADQGKLSYSSIQDQLVACRLACTVREVGNYYSVPISTIPYTAATVRIACWELDMTRYLCLIAC